MKPMARVSSPSSVTGEPSWSLSKAKATLLCGMGALSVTDRYRFCESFITRSVAGMGLWPATPAEARRTRRELQPPSPTPLARRDHAVDRGRAEAGQRDASGVAARARREHDRRQRDQPEPEPSARPHARASDLVGLFGLIISGRPRP